MALKKITDEERLVYAYDEDFEIYYRRLRKQELLNIENRVTTKGRYDSARAGEEILKLCVKGWNEGYIGDDDKPIKFSKEELLQLPNQILVELVKAVGSADSTNLLDKKAKN